MKNITIITGGSKGVGKELAREFLKRGENVCIVARNEATLTKTKNELTKEFDADIIAIAGDVSNEEFVKSLYATLEKTYNISCLVNNAGVGRFASVENNNAQMIDEVFSGIVKGTILMTTYALPYLKKSKEITKIVNIISQSGIRAYKHESVYCAAKWAQQGYSECLRLETFGTNIKVINVYPGGIDSEFWAQNRSYVNETIQSTFAKPAEVANLIVETLYSRDSLIMKNLVFEQKHMNLE